MSLPYPYQVSFHLPLAGAADPAPRKLPAAVTRKIDFAADVKPILQRSCIKCHANGKRKGGFNIDHIHTLLGGGDSGPAVVPGKSAESPLIELLLSNDPDERMPAQGDPLKLEEIAILRAWIDQGVKWEKGLEKIAAVIDRGTLIKTYRAADLGFILHSRHQYHWHTAYEPPLTVAAPHIGSWVSPHPRAAESGPARLHRHRANLRQRRERIAQGLSHGGLPR